MKIIAVGMNYAQHNQELGHTQVNTEPVVFMKPDSAIFRKDANIMNIWCAVPPEAVTVSLPLKNVPQINAKKTSFSYHNCWSKTLT